MRVCGIIAEYDPFHKGHQRHLDMAREKSQADWLVVVLGQSFSQRGLPALFSTHLRARMALMGGADLVLGMPVSYSCAQANRFALGGVGILHQLGVVTDLSFGVEQEALPYLSPTAALLIAPDEAFKARLKQALSEGKSFARAQGEALSAGLPGMPRGLVDQPNFVLALCYAQALDKLHSPIRMLPVPRAHSYHASGLDVLPSASAVRAAALRGDWKGLHEALPESSYALCKEAIMRGDIHLPDALDKLLLATALSPADHARIAEMSEGLDDRIRKLAPRAHSREALTALVKTKRYTYSRVSRALTGMMLGLFQEEPAPPPYARLLGMKERALPLLRAIKSGGFPLISRPSRHEALKQDMQAEALWYLGSGQAAEAAWKQPVITL